MNRQTWAEITVQMKPETRSRMEAEATRLSTELHLAQIRKARRLTQGSLGVSQAVVSKMERRGELYIGTLKKSSKR